MTLDNEIRKINARKKLNLSIPILTGTAGGLLGHWTGKAVSDYNSAVDGIEEQFQQILFHYRTKEERIEKEIDNIPGIGLWKKGQEVLFGKAQEYTGMRDAIDSESTETLVQVNPEDLSFQGIKLPESSISYPLLGITLGVAYGLMKVNSKIRSLNREQRILRMVSNK